MTTSFKKSFNIICGMLLCICPTCIYGFLPPIITERFIFSKLETIISTNAFSSSIFKSLNKEIDITQAFLQFVPMHFSSTSGCIYLSIAITVLYGQWRFYEGSQIKYDKLQKIDQFTRSEAVIKNILFFIIIILMKDIESAF